MYSQSRNSELKFVHITKTGGSTIENIGKDNGIEWGMFDTVLLSHHKKQKKFFHTTYTDTLLKFGKSIWHVPLRSFNRYPYNSEVVLFTVVRNPYTRCISEYYCGYTGNKNVNASKEEFNRWLQYKLLVKHHVSFIPHSDYVFDADGSQIVKHIIRFENLTEEFNSLMECYDLPCKLDRHDNKAKKTSKKYTVDDLDAYTIYLINQLYQKDFDNPFESFVLSTKYFVDSISRFIIHKLFRLLLITQTRSKSF